MIRYAITEGRVGVSQPEGSAAEARRRLLERCSALAAAGVDYVLIREKQMDAGSLLLLTREVVEACAPGRTKVLVARRADVALAAGADGVHLSGGAGELRAEQVRRVFAGAIVSRSCHTVAEVAAAAGTGVDLILFGPVFGKALDGVEVVAPVGLPRLTQACVAAGGVPVLALGGVTEATQTECMAAGAAGLGSIRMFFAGERVS